MRSLISPPIAGLVAFALLALPSCATPAVRERCELIASNAVAPPLPPDFAILDSLLIQRATSMATAARGLKRSLLVLYRREFLEELLPRLCDLVTEARAHATRGNTAEAGTRYQTLLVVSQVMQLEVALAQMADLADTHGQPSPSIAALLRDFDQDMLPLMEAALSLDRARLAAAIPEGARWYNTWLGRLDEWALAIQRNSRKVQAVLFAADVLMLSFTAYNLVAGAARGGAAPPPALAGISSGGVAVASRVDAAAIAGALAAIRKLVASGALDPAVVAGLSAMGAVHGGGPSVQRPSAMHMASQQSVPSNMAKVRKVNGQSPKNSEWAGKKYPLDKLPEELRPKYPDSIRFTEEGFPDFRPYALKEVKLQGLKGNYTTDFARANRAAGLERTPPEYTWHHHEDCTTMQLVPRDLHLAIKHTGGVAILTGRGP